MNDFVKRVSQKISKLPREQIIDLLNNSLEQNENLYSIIDSLSTGLLIVDNHFILKQNNTIAESRISFNTHLDDSKANSLPIWELIEDKDIAEYIKKCAENQITNSSEDFSTMTAGGSVRFLTITMTPLLFKNQVTGRIILIRDITETKNQEVMFHRMENLANLTNLAAGMAHEIKNPLGAISIHIQLIEKALEKARENENVLPPKKFVEDHISVVNEEIDHLNKLVMDFLLAVRPIKATLELKSPEKIIENTISFFEPEFNKYNVNVKLIKNKNDKRIMIDEKLFRDMILNFSQNALYAIKTRFPECNTERKNNSAEYIGLFLIECNTKDNHYIIKISDNGCGMSEETSSRIFEPYYTTKATGTGLGMTMVYKILKEFSADIQVVSQENEGTQFTLIFPIPQKDKKLITQAGE